ncbi:MAG: isochorismate synthase [Bacteroidota bacterium]
MKVVAQKKLALTNISGKNKQDRLKGFVLAPFHANEQFKKVIIQPDIFCDADRLPPLNFAPAAIKVSVTANKKKVKLKESSKRQFIKYLESIRSNNFKKIVAARVVKKKKPATFNAVDYFQLLCKMYPHAFVSLVFTKEYGLWIGATPEILLSVHQHEFKTYSLAGTKENTKVNTRNIWGKKEREEQKIVSDYIQKTFAAITQEKPRIEGPKTITAGNLLHLRTTFSYRSISTVDWHKIVDRLHPTPAVAGYPKQEAIDFILKNEKTNRSFYSGYLGPVNLDKEVNLFVNLRCMNVLKNKLLVYVGCGITADSNFADEWKETEIKSETLLSLLNQKKSFTKVSKTLAPLAEHEYQQKKRSPNRRNMPAKRNP